MLSGTLSVFVKVVGTARSGFDINIMMNKAKVIVALMMMFLFTSNLCGQNFDGYIITKEGEKTEGFIRFDQRDRDKGYQIKLYESKKSLDPIIFYTLDVDEYAYKEDTIKILRNFYPFKDDNLYINKTEVKIHTRGRVSIYQMEERVLLPGIEIAGLAMGLSIGIGGSIKKTIFLLEDETGYIAGIKKENFKQSLLDFFRDCSKCSYFINDRKFKYKNIPELARRYNAGEL